MNNNTTANNRERSQSRQGRSRTRSESRSRSRSRGPAPRAQSLPPKKDNAVKFQARNNLGSIPVAQARTRGLSEPRFSRSVGNGDITVDHEEFITDIVGSTGFVIQGFNVNPGLSVTFPWLNQMAPLYESYRFEKLEFCYQSSASSSSTGSVMMAVEYDASDALAPNKQSLAPYRGYVRTAPWKEATNISTKEDLNKRSSYFIRTGSVPSGSDIKLYDIGVLNIATQGQADGATIGELYVRYRVKLMTPQLQVTGLGTSQSMKIIGTGLASALVATGTAPIVVTGTPDLATLTSFAPYQGLVSVGVTGGATLVSIGFGGTAGLLVVSPFVLNAGATTMLACCEVNFTAPGQTLTIDVTGTSLTGFSVRLGNYQFSLT